MIPKAISCLLQLPYPTHYLLLLEAEVVLDGILEAPVGLIPHATAKVISIPFFILPL